MNLTEQQASEAARGDLSALRQTREKLIRLLFASLDDLPSQEILTDKQALRNLTAALKELRELCVADLPEDAPERLALLAEKEKKSARSLKEGKDGAGAQLTVAFEGEAALFCE